MTWPRLMTARRARRYLDGLDPLVDFGVAPEFHRGEAYYDRVQLDRAIEGNRATNPVREDDPDAALAAWEQSRGAP